MTADGSQKAKRMMELCDTFHLPIVNFLDEPGFMIGPESEKAGCIRYGMSAVAAAVQSTVPWATIAVHKSFGVASAAHFAPNTYKLSWPSHEMGALPVEGLPWPFTARLQRRIILTRNAGNWNRC